MISFREFHLDTTVYHQRKMKFSVVWFVVVLSVVISSLVKPLKADYPEDQHVLILDDETLKAALISFKKLFVMFYSPSCEHCQKAMPEFEKAAKKLHKEGYEEIRLAKVDASFARDMRDKEKFNFDHVPTFFYVNGDVSTRYYGERKAADFISYVKKKNGMAWDTVKQISDLDTLTADDDAVILGLFKDADSKEAEVFQMVATDVDGLPFGMSSEQELFDHFKVSGSHAVVALKKFDEGRNYFDDEWDVDDLTDWVRKQRLPIVIEFSSKTANAIFTGETRRHVVFVARKSSNDFLEQYLAFRKVAEMNRYKFLFIFIDADNKDNERVMSFFKTTPRDYPAIRAVGINDELSQVLKMEDSFSEESILKFIREVTSGKLAKRRGRKFQDEPSDWNARPLRTLVAGTFYNRIQNIDAFVLFYKPMAHCSKCPELLSIFSDLADQYYEGTVLIGKVDASQNDVDRIELKSVPAIKFFPKGLNLALDYRGEHSFEAFVRYIDNYSSRPESVRPPKQEPTQAKGQHTEL